MNTTEAMPDSYSHSNDHPGRFLAVNAPPKRIHDLLLLFVAYFLLALLFHAAGLNIFRILIGAGDGYTAGLPSKLFATQLSPWNPYVQLGQYSFANTQFQPFYPPALVIMALFKNTFGYNVFILVHYALAGLFFYLFARNRGLRDYASFVGGLLFMFGGFLSAHKGHQAMMSAAIWLPLMLLFADRYVENRHPRALAWAALAWALSILAGFPQVTLYSILVVVAYSFHRLHASGDRGWPWLLRGACALGGVAVTALLLSSLQLFAVAEALPQMTRDKLTYGAFSENYFPVYHVLGFIMPNLFGGFFKIPTYSPEFNPGEVYPYIGLLPLALAYVTLRYHHRENGDARFWGILGLAAFLLAIGQTTPLNSLLFHLPIYNLFRAPARHIFELDFAIAVLAAMALDLVFRPGASQNSRLRSSLRKASSALAVAFGGVYVISQILRAVTDWIARVPSRRLDDVFLSPLMRFGTAKGLIIKNLNPAFPTVLLPAVFFLLSFLALRIATRAKFRRLLIPALPLLIVLDLYLAYSTLYSKPDTSALGRPEALPETAFLAGQKFDRDSYRLFSLDKDGSNTYPLLNMTYGWSVVNDYSPMWLKRYAAMTDFELNGAMPLQNLRHPNILDAAGAQFLIARSPWYISELEGATRYGSSKAVPLVANPSMVLDHASPEAQGRYLLQAEGREGVSLLEAEIPLQKSERYQIDFTARAPSGVDKPLLVNLYGGIDYDNAAQYVVIPRIAATSTHQIAVIDSGTNAPKMAFVRIFTQSTTPVEISDIHISLLPRRHSYEVEPKVYQQVYAGPDGMAIFYNAGALPRFRFVQRAIPCRDALEARQIMDNDTGFNVATDALVEGISQPLSVAPGEILSREISNNHLSFQLKTGDRGLFVVGDSWFPGWKAKVDGKDTPILVVDGFLRGVILSGAGIHKLDMTYHPWSVPAGAAGTLLGLIVFGVAFRRKNVQGLTPSRLTTRDVPPSAGSGSFTGAEHVFNEPEGRD